MNRYTKYSTIMNAGQAAEKYHFFDIIELLIFLRTWKNLQSSYVEIMKAHRANPFFSLIDLVIENSKDYKAGRKTRYFLIHTDDEVVAISRLLYSGIDGYINAVHVNHKYRGQGYCKKNINKLLELGYEIGIKNYTLEVLADNTTAIKCYQSCGFSELAREEIDGETIIIMSHLVA